MLKLCWLMSESLGWRAGSADTILKGDHLRTIPSKFDSQLAKQFQRRRFLKNFLPNFLFLAMAAILVGGRGRRIQF